MFREIFNLLLSMIANTLGAAFLLRVYLSWLRISRSNPLAIFCVALTDWIVGPLRRIIPIRGRVDVASLVGALLVGLIYVFLLRWVILGGFGDWILILPSVIFLLVRWSLYLILFLLVFNSLLSIVNPHAPLAPTFDVLTRPILAPFRRFIPPIGGFDLSPMVPVFLIFVALTVLDELMRG